MGMDVAPELDIDVLLDDPQTRIVVCCGSGGVGKTTTAAALGVRAAERGRKVVVLTIDPARRLAQSMGIDALDNIPRRVEGVGDGDGGELHAMMLDMKRTFDEFVEAHADPERARAILANPFYQSLSAGFAGTQEYMAMEKLGQLRARDEWDLIIVDTPPSRSALDFLDAPKRLGSFLDGKFIKVLMAPAKVGGKAGMKFLNVGVSMMTGTVSKVLGGQLMRDVQTFAAAMDTMFGGFRTRAEATYRLLQAPGTAFLVVAAPERDALREAAYFVERLAADQMPLAGLVLNRVHGSGAEQLSAERALAAAEILSLTGDPADPADPDDALANAAEGSDPAKNDAGAENLADGGFVDPPSGNAQARNPSAADPDVSPTSADSSAERLAAGLLRLHAERMQVLGREQRTHDRFTALHPEVPVAQVAALPGDVHDLAGLRAIGDRLSVPLERTKRAG
ncbi:MULTISPECIES: ArsA family ATPase [Streptomyces]|uniref:ArsA family ATPase n=3 Tax=Streptomyces TaxID=1883 RepID=A0ABD5JQL2_9ACTN|nr:MULTISPECIES: ArsA family ATPase [Streptomyces]MEE4589968.1 ArsA family ATPase [Streptomyces sp. DSM 41602]AJZ86296.1 ArsA family ATPase [Streptomyces sp. AgN23]KUL45566.1 anion-transporting ATPase [Streptomyces violaceusniger]RSS34734.1 ArsA family ATPase [Streptomyces sp. WAC05858]WTA87145.1 ArsA family ATPase [Streptomyces antimycoticus]